MRRCALIVPVFAVLVAACTSASPPADPDVIAASDDPVAQSAALPADLDATTSTRTVTTSAVTEGVEPDIELLPPSPRGSSSGDAIEYFDFRRVAGADSYTARLIDVTSDGAAESEGVFELRVDGTTRQVSRSDAVEIESWIQSERGAWFSDGADWRPSTDVDHLMGLVAAVVSPTETYGALYAVADQLTFVGWQDRNGVTLARYQGDTDAAALVLAVGQVDGVRASTLDVWIDPAGFIAAFDARIEVANGAFREVRWYVTDINGTSIALPG